MIIPVWYLAPSFLWLDDLFTQLQVYLVGDPVQLPATVISSRAIEFNYDNSLFKRLQLAGYPVKVIGTVPCYLSHSLQENPCYIFNYYPNY